MLRGIDSIADALDALGDLTTSETVHQLVRGNHARAAAVLAALSEGTAIPHPEVTDTPRTGPARQPQAHPAAADRPCRAPSPGPSGWDAVPMTPRAALEPSVNHWLGGLLGDPGLIRVRLNADGLAAGSALPEVSLADLGLQPLDLVAMLADGFDSAVGALTARVLDTAPAGRPATGPARCGAGRRAADHRDRRVAHRVAAGAGVGARHPEHHGCRTAAGSRGRPARARRSPRNASDYAAPEFTATAGDGIDVDDLRARVQRLLDGAAADALRLAQLLAEAGAPDPTVLDGDPAVWLGDGARTRARRSGRRAPERVAADARAHDRARPPRSPSGWPGSTPSGAGGRPGAPPPRRRRLTASASACRGATSRARR